VTDEQPVPSVRDRLAAAGLSCERIEQHHAAGRVHVDSELVDDLVPNCRRGSSSVPGQ
jgi:hypothetical protein